MLGGYQRIRDSIIVGESDNLGEPTRNKIATNPNQFDTSIRGYPLPNSATTPIIGIKINAEGPTHIENVKFSNFLHNHVRKASAIAWNDNYPFHNGATTSATELQFDFSNPDEGYYIIDFGKEEGRGDDSIMMRDLDGSLTGQTDSTLVKPNMYFTSGDTCQAMPGANMDICQRHYSKVSIGHPNPFKQSWIGSESK